jgi:hypothetical protein
MAKFMARISIAGRQNPKDVSRETMRFLEFQGLNVSRETAKARVPNSDVSRETVVNHLS